MTLPRLLWEESNLPDHLAMSNLSASAARIRGDSYQHLAGWIQVLRACLPGSGVREIGIEDPETGNADDVTIYYADGRREFFQMKSAVDGRETANLGWLMKSSKVGGPSIIQGLFGVWRSYKDSGSDVNIEFHTNRPAATDDGFIALRDGMSGTVGQRLRGANSKDATGANRELQSHLGANEDELFRFLDRLRFRIGRLYDELREDARPLMYANGLRFDDEAITLGESIIRAWVMAGRRRLSMTDVSRELAALVRPDGLPTSSLLIQAIDRDPTAPTATITFDWVDLFQGQEPRTRRSLMDNGLWNNRFRKEIQEAARSLRARNESRVLVRGYMRLPTWFTVGVELGRTAGFDEVVSFQGGSPWSSKGDLVKFPIDVEIDEEISDNTGIAICLSVSADPSEDIKSYLRNTPNDVGRYVCIVPSGGTSSLAIQSAGEARQWALSTRNIVREITRKYRPPKLDVFLTIPHGAALLLGHLWDRMPDTQLYEDLGALGGYLSSFFIPN